MSVTTHHPLYAASLERWRLVDDVCAGEEIVKEKGVDYLPMSNPLDQSDENKARYRQYKFRAVLYEATGNTLDGLIGAAYRVDPTLVVPDELAYLGDDADGTGVSIYQQSQRCLAELLKKGRGGLLVDMPPVNGTLTVAQQQAQNIRAQVIFFDARQVINWRTTRVGSKHMLSLVVIAETAQQISDDDFILNEIEQYRALKLVGGKYKVEIWRKMKNVETGVEALAIAQEYFPLDGSGKPWDMIPFTFVGATNNDINPDRAPLLRLATVNLAHYRNSADFEHSAFIVGQPQPWMSGVDDTTRTFYSLPENKMKIGSGFPIMLPPGGQFAFAQPSPNTLIERAMDRKENQMIALGARLVQAGTVAKTATESRGDQRVQHSVLSLCVANMSEAYTHCLGWVARFMKVVPKDDMAYSVNQDYTETNLDPQALAQVIQSWQQGLLPKTDAWQYMRKVGLIRSDKPDKDIEGELDAEMAGGGLNEPAAVT
ncbi:MAG: DUF4055 domain-containing protein [Moraxellaceae bacterium]